jgi:hypothetical protein
MRGLDADPTSAMLRESGECHSLRFFADHSDGKQPFGSNRKNKQPPEQPPTKIGLSFLRGQFRSKSFILLVPGGGVEPPRGCPRRILSPLRLPVPPSRRFSYSNKLFGHRLHGLSVTRAPHSAGPARRAARRSPQPSSPPHPFIKSSQDRSSPPRRRIYPSESICILRTTRQESSRRP